MAGDLLFGTYIMAEAELPIQAFREQRGLLRRSVDWLFSQRHFHLKVLSGTAAGVTVILTLWPGSSGLRCAIIIRMRPAPTRST